MKKLIPIVFAAVLLCGCATTVERYSVERYVQGQKVKVDVLTIDGIGKGEYPDGAKMEGKPMIQFPQLPDLKYERD